MNKEKEKSLSEKRTKGDWYWAKDVKEAVLRLKEELIRNGYICIGDINEIFGEELAQHSYSSGTAKELSK